MKLSKANIRKAWKMKGTTRKNALKRAWRLKKGGKSSSRKSKTKTTKSKTSRSSKGGRKTTTKGKGRKRIPLSVITGMVTSIYAPPNPGWGSVMQKVQAGAFDQAAQSFVAAWTGLRLGGIGGQAETQIDVMGVINPFDMRNAPAMKTMLWTKLATKITRKIAGNPFTRIPFVKDYLSFS